MKKYPLSKSRIIDGLSCDRKLWLKKHKKHLATPFSDHTKYLMRNGTEVGKIAHKLHQKGILVEGGWFDPETAKAETEKLIENGAPVLFEAAFMADGLLHLADIIINNGDQVCRGVFFIFNISVNLKFFIYFAFYIPVHLCFWLRCHDIGARDSHRVSWQRLFRNSAIPQLRNSAIRNK